VVTVAPATTITLLDGDGQTADQGDPVPTRPSVKVTNGLGEGIAGVGVTFVVTGGNGSVSGAAQTTNSAGEATVGSWVLGDAGTNTLEARAPGLNGNPVVFTATANPTSAGGHLVFLTQPGSSQVEDQVMTPAVQVAIEDDGGNVLDISGVTIALELRPHGDRLDGDRTRETSGGIAGFDDLSVSHDGDYTLRASVPGNRDLGEVESEGFTVEKSGN